MELEIKAIAVFVAIGLFVLIPLIATTFETGSPQAFTPTGMIIESVSEEPGTEIPSLSTNSFGPEGFYREVQTPYGKFTLRINYESVFCMMEGYDKTISITEKAGYKNRILTTPDYTLNISQYPSKTVELFSNPEGWIENTRESGTEKTTWSGTNFSYIESLYTGAVEILDEQEEIMRGIMDNMSIPFTTSHSRIEGIYVNEFLADSYEDEPENEWIEIYNNRSSSFDISGWFLDDSEGGSSMYEIPQGTIIESKGILLFYGNETGIQLNNNADSVRILDSAGYVVDSISYESAQENISIARMPDGSDSWVNLSIPTPGSLNT